MMEAAVANSHPANVGDVLKHLVLCAAIETEAPVRYLESHGGRANYDLTDVETGVGGIWDFLSAAPQGSPLGDATFARLERSVTGNSQTPGTYLGSTALADALLPATSPIYVAELNSDSAHDLKIYFAARGRESLVHRGDGVDFVCEAAQWNDLVLLDPFDVAREKSPGGRTSATAFAELAGRGVPTLLWYAITERHWRLDWLDELGATTKCLPWRAEIRLPETSAGLLGCGMLGANIRGETELEITWLTLQLARVLATSIPGLRSAVASPESAPRPDLWNPFGAARPTAADLRDTVARVGFPLSVLDKNGEAWTRPVTAREVFVYDEPGWPPKLVLCDGNDRPTTVNAAAIRNTEITDEDDCTYTLVRETANE